MLAQNILRFSFFVICKIIPKISLLTQVLFASEFVTLGPFVGLGSTSYFSFSASHLPPSSLWCLLASDIPLTTDGAALAPALFVRTFCYLHFLLIFFYTLSPLPTISSGIWLHFPCLPESHLYFFLLSFSVVAPGFVICVFLSYCVINSLRISYMETICFMLPL